MRKAAAVLALLLASVFSGLVLTPDSAHANPGHVQNCGNATGLTGVTSLTCTLTQPITAGNMIAVTVDSPAGTNTAPTDTLGNTYTLQGSSADTSGTIHTTIEVFTTLSVGGPSDIISSSQASTTWMVVAAGEFSGLTSATATIVRTGHGLVSSGTSYTTPVASASYGTSAFVLQAVGQARCGNGFAGFQSPPGNGVFGTGSAPVVSVICSGLTPFVQQIGDFIWESWNTANNPSTLPALFTGNLDPSSSGNSDGWASVALEFSALTVTQPLTATATGGATTQTITLNSSCSPSPGSFSGDGTTHNIVSLSSCTLILFLPAGYVWTANGAQAITVTTCASGTCAAASFSYQPGSSTVTQPLQAIATGGASTQTITVLGCAGGTILGDGLVHNVAASPSCAIQLVLPSGYLWVSNNLDTVSLTSCATGTCSLASFSYFQVVTTVTQPLKATPTNGATTQTVGVTGCSVSPSTVSGDGASHNVLAGPSCILTLTLPVGFVWTVNGAISVTTLTCALGTCTLASFTFEPLSALTPVHLVSSHTRIYDVGGTSGYLFLGSDVYASVVKVEGGNSTYYFQAAAIGSGSNPRQTFSLAVTAGANMTLTSIGALTVGYSSTATVSSTVHTFFYYAGIPAPNYVNVTQNASTTQILQANFYLTLAAFNAAAQPAVFLNSTGHYVEVKATQATTTTYLISFASASSTLFSVQTSPDLQTSLKIDGLTYNSPQTFSWSTGSSHTIDALSPSYLALAPYTEFSFVSWSDGGSQSHSVVAPSVSTVYTATYIPTSQSVSCGSPNPLQQLEKGCVVPALMMAWSAPIGLQPWLGFILLGINVAIYNKTQNVWLTLTVLWVTGAVFSLFLPPYVSLVAQVFLYLGLAGIVVKGVLLVR